MAKKTMPKSSSEKKRPASSGRKNAARPKKETKETSQLSERETARRLRHESAKKHHVPTDIERLYTGGKLPVWEPGWLLIQGARQHNLDGIDVPFPLSAMTVVTGVSGSGKSSLVEDILYAQLSKTLHRSQEQPGAHDRILGIERLNKVIAVDQRPLGQTPTSNPATYTGVFDKIRELFSRLPESKMRGYAPRRFSFNVPGGRCEKCEGAGQRKIEMHFLADVWIECEACGGKRYDSATLEILYRGKTIAEVLAMSCADARRLFANIPAIERILRTLCDVGLDYISLGQSATTLSGGEAQRVKLAAELARPDTGRTLYILDEPTTGLHFDDLRRLLDVLNRLTDLGNTVVLIEHHTDLIKSADWVIDLGPEAGRGGGRLVFAGTPESLADYGRTWLAMSPKLQEKTLRSHTAEALLPVLESGVYEERPPFDAVEYQRELERLASTDWEAQIERDVPVPWEKDGRRWHTAERRSRAGNPCRWEGRILAEVIDKIEESDAFADTDWNNRSIVEIRAKKKSTGWFFHAITGEEWILKMKFRVPKNTFRKDDLIASLGLRPLNEMPDIPLYGTQNRTRVETTGVWQEIELRVGRYDEIDTEPFRDFLDKAIRQFGAATTGARSTQVDPMPWKTLGESWHFTPGHCYGERAQPKWPIAILERVVRGIHAVAPTCRAVWTNKILVPFHHPSIADHPWLVLNTKNCESLGVTIHVPKNAIPLGRILDLGSEPEVDGSRPGIDLLSLHFRSESDFHAKEFEQLLHETLTEHRV